MKLMFLFAKGLGRRVVVGKNRTFDVSALLLGYY